MFKKLIENITLRSFLTILKKVLIPAVLFYILSLVVLRSNGFGIMEIIRDTAQITKESSFLGFLSNIGIWIWISSVSICFFVIITKKNSLSKNHIQLLLLSGLLSLLLAVDDFFMIHDRYVNQNVCYLLYGILALSLLIKHYSLILKIEPMAFIMMGLFLMSSIFTDLIQGYIPMKYSHIQIFEEGFKFVGASTWLYFNIKVGDYNS